MDNPVMATPGEPPQHPLSAHPSIGRGRTRLVVVLAVVLGITAVVAAAAGLPGGAPATAAPTSPTASGHHASSTPAASSTGGSPGGSDLYVVDATSGSASRTGPATWRLALTGASVLWFKDRPFRGSGGLSAQSLASTWATSFAGSPPYGAVLAPAGPTGHHPTAVKLTSPSFDRSTGVLSFTVTPDAGESTADAAWLSKLTVASAEKNGRVVLFIDNSTSGGPTQEDEAIVEYFNMLEFSEDIYIDVADLGTSFALTLNCPPPISPTIPGPDFELTMVNSDNSASTTCSNQVPLVFDKAQLAANKYGNCPNGTICTFLVVLSNASTQTIYCQTVIQITMTSGNNTIIPNLNPATLPLYPSSFNPCLLTGTCPLSTSGPSPATKLSDAIVPGLQPTPG